MSARFTPAARHPAVALATLAIALLAGCTTAATPPEAAEVTPISLPDVIEATATYRERIALPPGAVFGAVLEDVSRAHAPGAAPRLCVTLEGDRISFTRGIASQMMCSPELGELARLLSDALTRASRWQVEGNTLEIRDVAGARLALLEAVHLG